MTQSVERGWDLQSQRVGGPPADILGSQLALIPMSYAGVSFFLCRVHTTNKQRINVSSAELLPKQTHQANHQCLLISMKNETLRQPRLYLASR